MPVQVTYPGVYIDELKSTVHTITGVPTSIAAFVGTAERGPTDAPVHITSFADFQRIFGGVTANCLMSYAVQQFYLNGGSEAEIVRIVGTGASAATIDLTKFKLQARNPGTWGNSVRVRIEDPPGGGSTYDLTALDTDTGTIERYLDVSPGRSGDHTLDTLLANSALLSVPSDASLDAAPDASKAIDPKDKDQNPFSDAHADRYAAGTGGADSDTPAAADYLGGDTGVADKTGIYQLYKTDIFNLLCLPGAPAALLPYAAELCVDRRAVLLVDAPTAWLDISSAVTGMMSDAPVTGDDAKNAAVYFPDVTVSDAATKNGAPKTIPPCGTMAGVLARTDVQRGVWKAGAGTDASLNGVQKLTVPMTDLENGRLNQLGVNCLRTFPVVGSVSWGARTMRGADRLADEWKYLPIRRLALFVEESLYRGTQWVVFEPNDEPLWSSIRMNVGAFMNNLFRAGAFQGATPRDAYLVKCDKENNPQNDIDLGIVNILVGFAPLKPAEFVIIHIQQLSPQLQF